MSDEGEIAAAVDEAIKSNPDAVAAYKAGKTIALGALVGPVMKKLGRKANAAVVNRIITERIA
jgi:aspartyl-tRNA(Asn)/glutamyl-tRNA(Gln) amidotransferase subunit B